MLGDGGAAGGRGRAAARLGAAVPCLRGVLWLSVLALIVLIAPVSALGAWLLAPYLAWVGFAAWLNLAVVRLNAPFG